MSVVPKQRLEMSINKLLLAIPLGLALAACGGQQTDGTAAQQTGAGEMPQAGDTGTVTGSPAQDVVGTDPNYGQTTGDASTMGEGGLTPTDPTTGTVDPMQTDPALQGTDQMDQTDQLDQQQQTPPPPTQ